jgi:hypothetical protein
MHAASRLAVGIPGRRGLLKLLSTAYRWRYPRRSKRQQQAMARFARCGDRKPDDQVAAEIADLRRHWGCHPFHYFRYDLYRAGRATTSVERRAFIPEFFLYHVFLPLQEGTGDPRVLGDKLRTVALFRERGIEQPVVLGMARGGQWFSHEARPLGAAGLLESWSRQGPERVFMKPAAGSGGRGILVLRPADGGWADATGAGMTADRLGRMARTDDWLVQAGVEQIEETARYYRTSVNTFRINSSVIDGEARIHCAVIRIGGGGRELDNAALGGIMVGVDPQSGETTPFAGNELMETFPTHPDSGHRFASETLASWSSIREFVLDAARRIPEYRHIAWDIAATPDGPIALEANIGFGIDCYQSILGGLADSFGIDEPDRFWGRR